MGVIGELNEVKWNKPEVAVDSHYVVPRKNRKRIECAYFIVHVLKTLKNLMYGLPFKMHNEICKIKVFK